MKDALKIVQRLAKKADRLRPWGPVTHIYNPLQYASENVKAYFERYAHSPVDTLFLGMNPGPFGMAQTGIPFGDVSRVREYLKLNGAIKRPPNQHPKRPILGFNYPRKEVSGHRFWTWIEESYGPAEIFFKKAFVWNFCPLAFVDENGKNLTPDKLKAPQLKAHLLDSTQALRDLAKVMKFKRVIALGHFAKEQAKMSLPELEVFYLLHPSPMNPKANKNWDKMASDLLTELNLKRPN